ncbi:hypothetical protein FXO38_11738 [Capsicum annuum]|nr:hypothetical protein FXO38_11738 [Capsicum annuum]
MDISEKKSIPQEVEDDYVAPIVSSYNDELLRSLFNCVDRVCAAHQFIQPPTVPTIVLVGDRCSGKSSLVASLIGIKLPRFCTRLPVLIKLQNHQSPKLEFSIEFDGMEKSSSRTDHDNDEWSVASEITRATNAIADGIVCNKALTVNLKKNGFPNLTIVDLPGIPTISKYDDQDHTIKETCEQMIMEYITPEDRIILNVLSTSSDSLPNKLESMNMSLKVDEKRERTLVVVTKVDKAPDRFLDELLLDKVTAMGHSYVCVRNNIDSESFKESECAVATLFKLLSIPKTSVGITILARTLMLIQAKITSIDITSKIKDRLVAKLDEDCRSTGARTIVEMLDQYSAELHSIINLENKQGLFLMDEIKYIEERKDSTKKALENLIAKKKDASVNWAREIIEMERLAAGFHTCNYAASCNRLLAQGTSFMEIINNPKNNGTFARDLKEAPHLKNSVKLLEESKNEVSKISTKIHIRSLQLVLSPTGWSSSNPSLRKSFVSCLRCLVCGILAGPSHHIKSKGLVVSNKDIESDIMDQTKNQENESLKQEILRLRQQMIEMHRAWASGLPSPPFNVIDPANTLSFPSQLQAPCSNVADAPQQASEFLPRQKNLNTSATISLAPQHKSTTFTTPHVVFDFVVQSSLETSILASRPTVVLPHAVSGSMFDTLGDHCYTFEPTFKLTGPLKFLNKKSSVPEESEKMVGKMKSAESAIGLTGKEDVLYKDWGMSSSVNPPPSLEISKFEERDG